jgi:SAM-dependent methyltransferase
VWQAVFAVVEVTSDPEHDPGRERWAWSFAIRPLVAVRDLHDAPPLEAAGIFPQSLWRHSYIRLAREQFEAAESLIARAVVRSGYDTIAAGYSNWAGSFESPVLKTLDRLVEQLSPGAEVLDLGCGSGLPIARRLVDRGFAVTGVDFSAEQVARASANVPESRLLCADALEVEFPDESFDAVVTAFVLGHVPRRDQPELVARIARWLRPGGRALLSFATADKEVYDPDWLGAPTYWASYAPDESLALVVDAGLEVEWSQVVAEPEPDEPTSFLWVLARAQP